MAVSSVAVRSSQDGSRASAAAAAPGRPAFSVSVIPRTPASHASNSAMRSLTRLRASVKARAPLGAGMRASCGSSRRRCNTSRAARAEVADLACSRAGRNVVRTNTSPCSVAALPRAKSKSRLSFPRIGAGGTESMISNSSALRSLAEAVTVRDCIAASASLLRR